MLHFATMHQLYAPNSGLRCGADPLDAVAEQRNHYTPMGLPQSAAFPGLSHPPLDVHDEYQDDQLAMMFRRMCSGIDEGSLQQHAMVRWGDLHQRITSGSMPLMLSHASRGPQIETPASEGSAVSLACEVTNGASILPLEEDEDVPTVASEIDLFRLTDEVIATTIGRALQGSVTACVMLLSGRLHSNQIRPLAMYKLLEPLATAGLLRSRLRIFVDHFTTRVQKHAVVDVTQTAFAVAVGAVVHMHAVQLQTCVDSVSDRRAAEANSDDIDAEIDCFPTPHELLHHTTAIRNQVLHQGD